MKVHLSSVLDEGQKKIAVSFPLIELGKGNFKEVGLAFLYDKKNSSIEQILVRSKVTEISSLEFENLKKISTLSPKWKLYPLASEKKEGEDPKKKIYENLDFFQPYGGDALNELFKNQERSMNEEELNAFFRDYGQSLTEDLVALHHAEAAHLDIKPANALYKKGQASLIDFGASHYVEQVTGLSGREMGFLAQSPAYSSPERIANQTIVDASHFFKTDIWSLGMTFWTLTHGGKNPCVKNDENFPTFQEKMKNINSYSKLHEVCGISCETKQTETKDIKKDPSLSPYGGIICAMLNPDRDQRPSAQEVLNQIERLLGRKPSKERAASKEVHFAVNTQNFRLETPIENAFISILQKTIEQDLHSQSTRSKEQYNGKTIQEYLKCILDRIKKPLDNLFIDTLTKTINTNCKLSQKLPGVQLYSISDGEQEKIAVSFPLAPLGSGSFKEVDLAFLYDRNSSRFEQILAHSKFKQISGSELKILEKISKISPKWKLYPLVLQEQLASQKQKDSISEKLSFFQPYGGKSLATIFLDKEDREDKKKIELKEFFNTYGRSLIDDLTLLHHEGIVHLDIKPANMVYDENTKQARLIDFDGAHSLSQNSETSKDDGKMDHQISFTYLPPELYNNLKKNISLKADIWSLGLSFWHLSTNSIPTCLQGDNPFVIFSKIKNLKDYKDLCTSCKMWCNAEENGTQAPINNYEKIIYDMLNPNSESRPSANEILTRLESLLGRRPSKERAPSKEIKFRLNEAPAVSPEKDKPEFNHPSRRPQIQP